MSLLPPKKVQKLRAALHAQAKAWSNPPAARESMNLLREPDAGDPHVRFDERDVETEQGRDTQTPTTERVGNTLRSTYTTAPRLDSTARGSVLSGYALYAYNNPANRTIRPNVRMIE